MCDFFRLLTGLKEGDGAMAYVPSNCFEGRFYSVSFFAVFILDTFDLCHISSLCCVALDSLLGNFWKVISFVF